MLLSSQNNGAIRAAARTRRGDNRRGNHHTQYLSRQISVAVVPNLVFLQQPIISKKCDGLLQLERLMEALGRPSGAVPSMTPSMDHGIQYNTNPKFE